LLTVGGLAIPSYFLAIVLIFLLSLKLNLLPPAGFAPMLSDPGTALTYMLMPALCLSLRSAASIGRMLRSSLLEVLSQDYVRTARAKGVREWMVIRKHALRNAFNPVLTVIGVEASTLVGGTVVIERIFAWPGVGKLAADAIFARDFPVVQGVVLVIALAVVGFNVLVDVLYGYADPRITYG
jgi:peptide/nickel transport system permease protein